MDCSENECVCSVKKENNLGYYRLHSIWRKDGFFLNIASKDGAWRGEMTSDDVLNISSQLNMEPDYYLKECKKALTSHNGQSDMSYSVENGCFVWKKIDDQDSGIKIKMGSIMLQPAGFIDTIQNLVTAALDCNKKLQEQITELSKENETVLTNNKNLQEKFDELITVKETMENDLYAKFILLLNSKKQRIEELESKLSEIQVKSGNKTITHTDRPSTSFENPYEMDTDNDSDPDEIEYAWSKVKSSKKLNKTDSKVTKSTSKPHKSLKSKGIDAKSVKKSSVSIERVVGDQKNSDSVVKEKSVIPSTKDELLDFFYGES